MEPITIVGGLTAAAVSGMALSAGARLVPVAWQASRDLRRWSSSPDGTPETEGQRQNKRKAIRLKGRTRQSSIIGLYGDLLRHTDGSYTRGYDFPLQATMLAPDDVADSMVDGLADMLTVELPAGTVLQYRYAVGPDPGRAIA